MTPHIRFSSLREFSVDFCRKMGNPRFSSGRKEKENPIPWVV
jgi:hypothetical protein